MKSTHILLVYAIPKVNKIDIVNKFGYSVLHEALECDELDTAQVLIDKGGDINIKNNDGFTQLHVFVTWSRRHKQLDFLIKNLKSY